MKPLDSSSDDEAPKVASPTAGGGRTGKPSPAARPRGSRGRSGSTPPIVAGAAKAEDEHDAAASATESGSEGEAPVSSKKSTEQKIGQGGQAKNGASDASTLTSTPSSSTSASSQAARKGAAGSNVGARTYTRGLAKRQRF